MKTQKSQNKILGGGDPNLRSKFGAKEFYFGFFGFSLAVLALLPITVAAQFNLPNISDVKPTISLSADPSTPLPNSAITVTANLSGLTGTGGSNYIWFLNGIRQSGASGQNKNTFAFKAGAIGSIYIVAVSVTTPDGDNLSDAVNLTVSDVDLTWIANSQAPTDYKAKLMPTQNSVVTISALPSVYVPGTKNKMSIGNLVYNWSIDGKLDSANSGAGKNPYVLQVSNFFGNSYSVRLEVKTSDGAVSLNKFLTIPVVKPQVWLYSRDSKTNQPLGAALKDIMIMAVNLNLIAQTYFFTAPVKNLKWQWFVNNEEVNSETSKPWLATLDLTNFSGSFSTRIRVTVQNPDNELEMSESITNLEVK